MNAGKPVLWYICYSVVRIIMVVAENDERFIVKQNHILDMYRELNQPQCPEHLGEYYRSTM